MFWSDPYAGLAREAGRADLTEPAARLLRPARADLHRRLRRLAALFEFDPIRQEQVGVHEVADYYAACHDAYRKYHSAEGAVHMALNEGGRFDADGFTGQLRRLQADWAGVPPARVLEIGFGQGFNLAWLAQRHPGVEFTGIDLTPAHVGLARERMQAAGLGLGRVTLLQGDMHSLPLADSSVDEVFAVEAFCHAIDLPRALAEVARVLRPGGRFVLFDAYQHRPAQQLEPDEALAVELVGRGMALGRWQLLQEIREQAQRAGLQLQRDETLDALVMPSLKRLERVIRTVIRVPGLARRALARRPAARGRNVLSGYLMYPVTAMGLLTYRHLTWRRAEAAELSAAGPGTGVAGISAGTPS